MSWVSVGESLDRCRLTLRLRRPRSAAERVACNRESGWFFLVQQHTTVASGFYRLFSFASAVSKFFFTLNFTILLIKLRGIGLSNGNLTVLFAPS